jgi:hypothetical protein
MKMHIINNGKLILAIHCCLVVNHVTLNVQPQITLHGVKWRGKKNKKNGQPSNNSHLPLQFPHIMHPLTQSHTHYITISLQIHTISNGNLFSVKVVTAVPSGS